jgi:hypothetical protein
MKKLIAILVILFSCGTASAQVPPPINLGIMNLPQEGPVWCWAAVAQQIVAWKKGFYATPAQCALVAMGNGAHPSICCDMINPACNKTGSLEQIQGLILQFGGSFSAIAPPANPMILYGTLSSGHPIILQIATGPGMAHVVVLQGMSWFLTPMGPRAVLHINDPMSVYTMPVPFESIASVWMSAIVVN